MRIERGIQVALYGGQIDTIVFDAGVIAHHRDRERRKRQNEADVTFAKFSTLFSPYPDGKSAPSGESLWFRSCRGKRTNKRPFGETQDFLWPDETRLVKQIT